LGGTVVFLGRSKRHPTAPLQRNKVPKPKFKRPNAPCCVVVEKSLPGTFKAEITNLGTDGTAYVVINRKYQPAKVYWFWNR
jgi:hypothetical protein